MTLGGKGYVTSKSTKSTMSDARKVKFTSHYASSKTRNLHWLQNKKKYQKRISPVTKIPYILPNFVTYRGCFSWLRATGRTCLSVAPVIPISYLQNRITILACGNRTSYKAKYRKGAHYVNHTVNGFIIANQFYNYNSYHNSYTTQDSLDIAFDPRGMLVDSVNKIHWCVNSLLIACEHNGPYFVTQLCQPADQKMAEYDAIVFTYQ
jgi:hypothetical protein